jgi:hypothetical protein
MHHFEKSAGMIQYKPASVVPVPREIHIDMVTYGKGNNGSTDRFRRNLGKILVLIDCAFLFLYAQPNPSAGIHHFPEPVHLGHGSIPFGRTVRKQVIYILTLYTE